jgi:hypothetical protein
VYNIYDIDDEKTFLRTFHTSGEKSRNGLVKEFFSSVFSSAPRQTLEKKKTRHHRWHHTSVQYSVGIELFHIYNGSRINKRKKAQGGNRVR